MNFLLRHRFKLLLGILMVLIVIAPMIAGDVVAVSGRAGRGIALAVSISLLLAGSLVIGGRRGARVFMVALVVPSLCFEIVAHFLWTDELFVCNHGLRIVFLAFLIMQLLLHLFNPVLVTFDTLCASLCVYLLVGLLWMNGFMIIETLTPGSYVMTVRADNVTSGLIGEADRSLRMLYFSFTTITGVGYGDIIPATNDARMFAVMEALVGQSYLLIIVSRLVGLHVSQTVSKTTTEANSEFNLQQKGRTRVDP
jgi:voltage-gated potassium channel